MSPSHQPDASESTPIADHLETALVTAESDLTKYHLREAYQKCIVLMEGPTPDSE